MKTLVINYTFDASEKKVTFTDYPAIALERVLLIVNATDQTIIYNFADPVKGGTVATNVLTLELDTTSMSDSDKLLIYYDDAEAWQLTSLATAIKGEDWVNNLLAIQNKPVPSITYSPQLYAPLTQVTKNVIKGSGGNVFSIYITNDNAAVRYFQLHNKATAPSAGDVPVRSLKVPAGSANNPGVLMLGREFFGPGGQWFPTGIGWAISTTLATFTDSATNTEHIVNVDYV